MASLRLPWNVAGYYWSQPAAASYWSGIPFNRELSQDTASVTDTQATWPDVAKEERDLEREVPSVTVRCWETTSRESPSLQSEGWLAVEESSVSLDSSTRRPVESSRSSLRTSSGTLSPTLNTLKGRLSPPWMLSMPSRGKDVPSTDSEVKLPSRPTIKTNRPFSGPPNLTQRVIFPCYFNSLWYWKFPAASVKGRAILTVLSPAAMGRACLKGSFLVFQTSIYMRGETVLKKLVLDGFGLCPNKDNTVQWLKVEAPIHFQPLKAFLVASVLGFGWNLRWRDCLRM